MPPTNLINDIEAEARNRNTIRNGNTQLTALSSLVASMEKNQKLEIAQNKSLDKLDKTITKLTKNLDSLVKSNTTAGKYSAGFNKNLYQSNETAKLVARATDMTETNRLLRAILNKNTPSINNITSKDKTNLLGILGSILPAVTSVMAPAIQAAVLGLVTKGILDTIWDKVKNKFPWLPQGNESTGRPGVSGTTIANTTFATARAAAMGTERAINLAAQKEKQSKIFQLQELTDAKLRVEEDERQLKKLQDEQKSGKGAKGGKWGRQRAAARASDIVKKQEELAAHKAELSTVEEASAKVFSRTELETIKKTFTGAGRIAGKVMPGLGATINTASMADAIGEGNKSAAWLYGGAAVANLAEATPASAAAATVSTGLSLAGDVQMLSQKLGISSNKLSDAAAEKIYNTLMDKHANQGFAYSLTSILQALDEGGIQFSSVGRTTQVQQNEWDKIGAMVGTEERGNNRINGNWIVARPGTSKHELGLAADIFGIKNEDMFTGVAASQGFKVLKESKNGESWLHVQAGNEVALAKGGITKGPTSALIGEAGREAVIPLESDEGIAALAESMSKYNMKDGNNAILLQILKAVSSSDVVSVLQDINKNLKDSGGTMVSLSGFNNGGVTA